MPGHGEDSGATDSAVTQRAFLTGARLKLSRLQLEGDLTRLYRQLAEISAQALDVARVGVWLFEPHQLRCEALYDVAGATEPSPLQLAALPEYVAAVKEQRFVATSDARTEPATRELRPYLETWGITSMLDAAIYRNGLVVGIVCHEHVGPPREWKRDERQFAATVADLASHFLEVNERVAAEQQAHALALKLKDAQRLDALGRMAAGVAHDLNNLLGVITNGISVLEHGHDPAMLRDMADAARHAANLVAQLMSFGRKKTPQAQRLELQPVLEELERLAAPHTRGGRLVFDVEKGLTLWADQAQLLQVLLNLVTNAFQATGEGGVVVVRAHRKQGQVVFEVIDTGEGIAPENLDKLFDPFFTTRKEGHGIGLALVQQLVAQHGGEIKVSSALGDGTTFRLWWPADAPG
ncbi:MAG: sensor histidine kinase [Myxococcota bacterium]